MVPRALASLARCGLAVFTIALVLVVSVVGLACAAPAGDGHGPGHCLGNPGVPMDAVTLPMPGEDGSHADGAAADRASPDRGGIFVPPRV